MKVRVTLTVDVDEEAWELNYGIPASDKSAVREDVRNHVEGGVRDHLHELGLTKEA